MEAASELVGSPLFVCSGVAVVVGGLAGIGPAENQWSRERESTGSKLKFRRFFPFRTDGICIIIYREEC